MIRYELEMANREQEQLRTRAALWSLREVPIPTAHRRHARAGLRRC